MVVPLVGILIALLTTKLNMKRIFQKNLLMLLIINTKQFPKKQQEP